jgi:predicted XRE-type DNA-binding protein
MTGHRPFRELTKDFTPARRARVAAKAAELREAMTLEKLRKARSLSQEQVAEVLTVNQPAVAKLEKRGDMHVSNLALTSRRSAARLKSRRTSTRPPW